jgi:hypothetical protein
MTRCAHSDNPPDKPVPKRRQIELSDGWLFTLATGATCPRCELALREFDIEELKPGFVLDCRNGHRFPLTRGALMKLQAPVAKAAPPRPARPQGVRYVLVIEALPGIDPVRSLRWVLKGLLRRHGFRCIDLHHGK